MSEYDRPHLDISSLVQRGEYKSPTSNARSDAVQRIRADHGQRLATELHEAFARADEGQGAPLADLPDINPAGGIYLEVELSPGAGALLVERKTEGTRQSAEKVLENGARTLALFVPDEARDKIAAVIADYTDGEITSPKGTPPRASRVEPLEHFREARLRTFWRDDPEALPTDPQAELWWGAWCFNDRVDRVTEIAEALGMQVGDAGTRMLFPETTVVPLFGRVSAIELLLFASGGIAELRRASDNPAVFTQELKEDLPAFVEDLAGRITWPGAQAAAVCLLDSGVNRAHPLIEPALSENDLLALDPAWGGDDHEHGPGHGTGMASLALHGDLVAPLADQSEPVLSHRIESIKILPPQGFPPNEPHSYGPITQSAVALAEINNPERSRVFCMAVTNSNRTGAEASAWSAAIDQAAAGAEGGDPDNPGPRRLFMLAAGNVPDSAVAADIEDADAFPALDPAQAWNALAIGGYTQRTDIAEAGYEDWSAAAAVGELSPYSRTSYLWDSSKSPFKPDLVLEAGNRALSPSGLEAVAGLDSLSLLAASRNVDTEPLTPFWATSAATAQASRMAAQIAAAMPGYWPETVRALMVHSANWTDPMRAALDASPGKTQKANCLRRFGYGVPDLGRALASASDDLALVAQNHIQPFRKDGAVRFNEAHLYELPWPREVLEDLDNTRVRLKVTLSYFIEPNPSFASAIDPARYQSFGLRFDLKRSRETAARFHRRNNAEMAGNGAGAASDPDSGWLFGPRSVSAGSLHMDIWEGAAVELAARNMIYVKPITGWWRERTGLGRYNDKARYALIVSIETPEAEVDLYSPIEALIPTAIEIET
ncbi:MAG: S8 family peptidase [Sphingomonadales bacterium]|nr:S8 family peptidase [Sphingomonadales bacterium]MBD3774354.1 S8 family peptidase [Paracoccaceae bacterium]